LFILNSGISIYGKKLGLPDVIFIVSFYLNYLINVLIVLKLIDGEFPLISKNLDAKMGRYSYPFYLFHWQGGFIASMFVFGYPIRGGNIYGVISLCIALIICFVVSYLVIRFVDLPIEKYRYRVKERVNKPLNIA